MMRLISATGRLHGPEILFYVLIALIMLGGLFDRRESEPNICTLEYRGLYLATHDNDAVLRRECPFEPWYR
jgi:hypothetical protein